jgi:hypothetical protein
MHWCISGEVVGGFERLMGRSSWRYTLPGVVVLNGVIRLRVTGLLFSRMC